jgi:hypothetical protein
MLRFKHVVLQIERSQGFSHLVLSLKSGRKQVIVVPILRISSFLRPGEQDVVLISVMFRFSRLEKTDLGWEAKWVEARDAFASAIPIGAFQRMLGPRDFAAIAYWSSTVVYDRSSQSIHFEPTK